MLILPENFSYFSASHFTPCTKIFWKYRASTLPPYTHTYTSGSSRFSPGFS